MGRKSEPELPADLREYLADPQSKRSFKFTQGEVRECTLYTLDEMKLSTFTVGTFSFARAEKWKKDPEEQYEFDGFNLIKSCNSHLPDGILVWFPELQQYGSWDNDHLTILVFPFAKWADIRRDLRRFINAQWCPEIAPLATYLRPWE